MKAAMGLFFSLFAMASFGGQAVVFQADFNQPGALDAWQGAGGRMVEGHQGTPSLLIEAAEAADRVVRWIELPAQRLAGQFIALSAVVKAEAVSKPPRGWNGIKAMLTFETEHGEQHPQAQLPDGAFDWTPASLTTRAPKGLIKATLTLGLEQVSGKAWFDNVEIRVGLPDSGGQRNETLFKGHDLPRLRGVMHGPRFAEENFRDLAQWGVNQVRWQLHWTAGPKAVDSADLDAYEGWLDSALEECDKAIDACQRYGIVALVDLHSSPGGRNADGQHRIFTGARCQDKFIEVWERIARRYKGREAIYAYDLVNEPIERSVAPGLLSWRDLAAKAARAIRAVDPGKPIVFEPGPGGMCKGFDTLKPLDLDRVIYSFHMYLPQAFTHQGVKGREWGAVYPGIIDGQMWDKEQLQETMAPALEFQRRYNVQIYVGEFSAVRWAPDHSAWRYLSDVIDLFEERGWDWSYHSFREWDGWSVEHGSDPKDHSPSPTPTDRQELLLRWFAKNQKPKR